jgi:nucleotide-binding universal stress UspA family protein
VVQIEKILCPVDFFPGSEAALKYAIALAKNYEASLHIVHVVPPVTSLLPLPKNRANLVKAEHDEAELRLARMAKAARTAKVPVTTEVRLGEVDHEILSAIGETGAALVVAGTHGRRGFQHWLIGSVCERLLRKVPVPIMTIGGARKAAAVPDIKRVLIAVDLSEGSADAVSFGFSIAQECQSAVTLLHVADFVMGDISDQYKQSLLEGVRLELQKLIPPEAPNWCDIKTLVEFGVPYNVILNMAEKEKADIIVLGTHGHTMLDRTILGSNAERVIRGASAPVLAVPAKPQAV